MSKRPVSDPGLWIGDLVVHIGVLPHGDSRQGKSSVSLTHDDAIIIPGINEEATVTEKEPVTENFTWHIW